MVLKFNGFLLFVLSLPSGVDAKHEVEVLVITLRIHEHFLGENVIFNFFSAFLHYLLNRLAQFFLLPLITRISFFSQNSLFLPTGRTAPVPLRNMLQYSVKTVSMKAIVAFCALYKSICILPYLFTNRTFVRVGNNLTT